MIDGFTSSGDIIMATVTSTLHLEVIDRYRRFPYAGRMTVFANIGATDMLQSLTRRTDSIMAAATVFGDSSMIKARRNPGRGRVAIVTGLRAGNMG